MIPTYTRGEQAAYQWEERPACTSWELGKRRLRFCYGLLKQGLGPLQACRGGCYLLSGPSSSKGLEPAC